jgi:DNA repair exonuclease SbcCD nuclease subunit
MEKCCTKVCGNYVGVVHLTDIHLTANQDNQILKRKQFMFRALKDDFSSCQLIYIVVSGDITSSGKQNEYLIAIDFFNDLSQLLSERYRTAKIKFVFTPGNHDCNFKLDSQVRRKVLKDIDYATLGSDDSVFEVCLGIQKEFWEFYECYNPIPENRMYYEVMDSVQDKSICFHCFNTAWMSQKDEVLGSLFFPVRHFENIPKDSVFDLDIAVFHHPLNWFTPKTIENNKNEFQSLLEDSASLQLVGHEHENQLRNTENIDSTFSQTLYAAGETLQNHSSSEQSGFQTFSIDLDKNKALLRKYRWKQDLYSKYSEQEIILSRKSRRVVDLKEAFVQKINAIDLPLKFAGKEIGLSHIYVFPDLEVVTLKSQDIIENYVDSESLLNDNQVGKYILEGDSQIGKTSLLRMLLLKFYERGYYPIFLEGKDINSDNVDKIIHKAFKTQYSEEELPYQKYRQIDNSRKILLIDDFHLCRLTGLVRNQMLQRVFDLFPRTFLTIDTIHSICTQPEAEFADAQLYSISSLGYKKGNDLVERYLLSKEHPALNEQDMLEKVRGAFNQLHQILGDKLIPSYPVFILSILQALEYEPLSLDATSYGYCYQTLMYLSLNSVGISKDEIDTYMNFITELAFKMFSSKHSSITEGSFREFYAEYEERFVTPSFEKMESNLTKSKILRQDAGSYGFCYKYIYYFLAAKKVADIIDMPEGKRILTELYDSLYNETNANILVFVTHHTRNTTFIEEALRASMLIFESTEPITLDRHCDYHRLLATLVQEIKNNVIEIDRDPSEERRQLLSEQDRIVRKSRCVKSDVDDCNLNEQTIRLIRALRSIEIMGQIVKNRRGSLEKEVLREMLIELYYTGFKMIKYIGEMIRECKDDLFLVACDKVTEKDNDQDIEMTIYRLLQVVSLRSCLGIFSKLIHSIGVKELEGMYLEVATTIDSPAAKLVSFSINSYYGRMNMHELRNLAEEFRGNMVALQILRARVRSYVYNNYVDYRDKQRIAEYLKMEISPRLGQQRQEIYS